MARYLLISALALLAPAGPVLAQEKATATPAPAVTPSPRPFNLGPKAQREAQRGGPEVQNVLKALEALTPEQQMKFKDNFIKWMNLPPEKKRELREKEETRRVRMAEEINGAIVQSGLQLEPGQRAKYAKRYSEERRKIEEKLRQEMEERRKPLVDDLVTRLRVEFSGTAPVAATPPPAQP